MASAKPTILLIHGAFHTGASWGRVIDRLAAKGYRCLAPQLAFVGGTGKAISTWHPCVDQVQKILSEETSVGRDVVVVSHSLGGVAGCSGIQGFTTSNPTHLKEGSGRVTGLVQVTGITIRDTEHYHEVFKHMPSDPNEDGWKSAPLHVATQIFYSDLEPQDADYWASQLVPNSAWLDKSAEGTYPGFKDVPVWFLVCDQDRMLPPAQQGSFMDVIREVNSNLTVRHIDSGHSPLLNKPGETADCIHQAAESFAS